MEMGRRDLRRGGTNRFSKNQSGSEFSAKSKKGMFKKLSLADEKLGYNFAASDLDRKKSKLPKKNMKNTNGVDHTSVPRKLRSAMKKRNLESVNKLSSASKRLNRSKTGIEFCKELIKKENQEMIVSELMMISKDEKEVVETLHSLADMITEADSIDKKETSKIDSILAMETDLTEAESLEPAVSVKQIDEKPLEEDDNRQHSLMEPARVIETKVTSNGTDYKSNGLALWPGLSSTKLPPWMDSTASTSKNASPLRTHPKKLKKCASHIYISRLIKVLQIEQRSSVPTMVSPSKRYQNLQLFGLDKTHNPKPVQEDMTKPALELFGPHKSSQSYDFLSLSFPGSAQSSSPLPSSFPQYRTSAAYNSHLSPAATSSYQVQQISPYLASRYQTAYNENQQQQQQLQKRLWAAQYRPSISGITAPPPSSQYSKPNLSLNLTNTQPLHVASSPRYNNSVSQQQHRLMAAAAMSMSHQHKNNPSRMVMNRQERSFPLIYDDSRTPLQLLCHEQL